ncbi:glycosyltransferase family 4 protein [Marinobacter sp. GN3S48]|uniref:glycosyltransferase family 4 protein n=1 Tax=Marinobacter sp. GN3S48 TaxID=3382302 RepID=UPI00387B592E
MARTVGHVAGTFSDPMRKVDQGPGERVDRKALINRSAIPLNEPQQARHRIAMVGNLAETLLGFRGELIKDMVRAGHEVYAFATNYSRKTERAILAMGAIPVKYQMGRLNTNPVADLISTWQLCRLFKSYNISLTFCFFTKPSIWGTLAASMAGVSVRVAKIEGMGRVFTNGPKGSGLRKRLLQSVVNLLFRFSLPKAHHVLVLNRDDQQDLQNLGIKKPLPTMIGGIGVCLDRYSFNPPVADPVRFIFVGRLIREKGIRYFLDAARSLKNRYPDVEFIVLGAPDEKHGISKHEMKQLAAENIITYPGTVDNVVPWLAESSVFVLPSYYREGVPRSTQEALAMGRPVITTDMPGCRETVEHEVNGYLVKPHNQHELEEAMLKLIRNPGLIAPMGEASYKLARERFNVREINQKILSTLGLATAEQAAGKRY